MVTVVVATRIVMKMTMVLLLMLLIVAMILMLLGIIWCWSLFMLKEAKRAREEERRRWPPFPLPTWTSQYTCRSPIRLKDDAAKKRKRETEAKSATSLCYSASRAISTHPSAPPGSSSRAATV